MDSVDEIQVLKQRVREGEAIQDSIKKMQKCLDMLQIPGAEVLIQITPDNARGTYSAVKFQAKVICNATGDSDMSGEEATIISSIEAMVESWKVALQLKFEQV